MSRRKISAEVQSMLTALEEDFPAEVEAEIIPTDPDSEGIQSVDTGMTAPSETVVDSVDTSVSEDGTTQDALTAGGDFDAQLAEVEGMIRAAEEDDDEDEDTTTASEDEDEDVTAASEDEDDGTTVEASGDDLDTINTMLDNLEAAMQASTKTGRTAKVKQMTARLDRVADALQNAGRNDLAERVDVVSNYLEAHASELV